MSTWLRYLKNYFSRLLSYKRPRGVFPVRRNTRPGRNEPCRCGCGKKYKAHLWHEDELSLRDYGRIY